MQQTFCAPKTITGDRVGSLEGKNILRQNRFQGEAFPSDPDIFAAIFLPKSGNRSGLQPPHRGRLRIHHLAILMPTSAVEIFRIGVRSQLG
ncbi:MAG: hypothetical protein ACJASX_000220 [Limisphaerales bacterium]